MGNNFLISALCAVCAAVFFSDVHAVSFSYAGTFSADDDVVLFNFSVDTESSVILRTYGYGGGVQDDGNAVAAGGFDPVLTLFDDAGLIIGGSVDDPTGESAVDMATGLALDAFLDQALPAGSYTVALTQYDNIIPGGTFDIGFFRVGDPAFTARLPDVNGSCSNGQFCSYDSLGNPVNRSSAWALDIRNVVSASVVPAPAAAWLFGSGLLGLIALARRNSAQETNA